MYCLQSALETVKAHAKYLRLSRAWIKITKIKIVCLSSWIVKERSQAVTHLQFYSLFFLGQQSKLHPVHQHELNKPAFSFCKGNFGGVKGKEFICVMFIDGSLKFFEQDGISQNCILPGNRTIPTSFVYVPRIDCFMILAPNWDLECYR